MRKAFLALLLLLAVVGTAQTQVTSYVSAPAAAPAGSTLNTGLIAFWKMDETSGTRDDAIGSNDLTANGTGGVGYGIGISGNAADIEKDDGDYLKIGDNADLSFADENFTISVWLNFETVTGYVISKRGASLEYALSISSSKMRFYVAGTYAVATSAGSTGAWNLYTAWYNAATDSIYIQMDDGTPTRASLAGGTTDGTGDFIVGTYSTTYYDGLVDDVGIWGRCPTSANGYAMADSIYNAGNGWRP